jgi:hypothetical protein
MHFVNDHQAGAPVSTGPAVGDRSRDYLAVPEGPGQAGA